MSKYAIRVNIADHLTVCEALETCTLKDLYRVGKSLCRNARHYQYSLGFSIVDNETGEKLVRLYSRPTSSGWVVRHSSSCKYSGSYKNGYSF